MIEGFDKVNIFCGHCNSTDVKVIERFNGEDVVPEDIYNDYKNGNGVVVQCKVCGDITGWLIKMTGVVKDE